jgi:hypothetical protein
MTDTFEEKLELGIKGEDIAYSYLIRKYSQVGDLRNQRHEVAGGPRLLGTEGTTILPDFSVYSKYNGAFAVDVKVKTSLYPVKGKRCFTVDNKYEHYKRAVQIMRLDYLAMIFIYEGRMYFYKDSDLFDKTNFDMQQSTGWVYCFEFDKDKWIY